MMNIPITKKWNSWNVAGINMFSSSAAGFEVYYTLLHEGERLDEIRNFNLHRLLHYSINDSYFEYEIKHNNLVLGVTIAAQGKTLILKLAPKGNLFNLFIEAGCRSAFGKRIKKTKNNDVLTVTNYTGEKYAVYFLHSDASVDKDKLLCRPEKQCYIVACPLAGIKKYGTTGSINRFIETVRKNYLSNTARIDKNNTSALRLAMAATNVATVYFEPLTHVATTSSREWSVGPIWGGYALFPWDSLLTSLISARFSKEIAYENVLTILEQQTERGLIPNGIGQIYTYKDRAIVPVESYCVLKHYRQFGEKTFIRKCYPYLKKSLLFYINYCDGNKDGLYEWGSFPHKQSKKQKEIIGKLEKLLPFGTGIGNIQGARYASGLDNHPSFDTAGYDNETHTMDINDIGLNSLLVNKAQCLEILAMELGYKKDANFYFDFCTRLKKNVQDNLWDEKAGMYKSRKWDGTFINAAGPMNFYPLLAGIPTKKQAKRMVQEHLLNPREFWGEYVIPAVCRNHPAFKDQNYWRGRIWGPTNYLVFEGLRRYGLEKIAKELAHKSFKLFAKEYEKDSHVHENYNAITGDGDDVNKSEDKIASDCFYPWGALLLLGELEMGKEWDILPKI